MKLHFSYKSTPPLLALLEAERGGTERGGTERGGAAWG